MKSNLSQKCQNWPTAIRWIIGFLITLFVIVFSPILALVCVDWWGLFNAVAWALEEYFHGLFNFIRLVFTKNFWFYKNPKS